MLHGTLGGSCQKASHMDNPFFDHPILNSPYAYPVRHWELDASGQPTQQISERRRPAEFITAGPQPHRQGGPEPARTDDGGSYKYLISLF